MGSSGYCVDNYGKISNGQSKLKSLVFLIFGSIDKKKSKQLNLQSCIKFETIGSWNIKFKCEISGGESC